MKKIKTYLLQKAIKSKLNQRQRIVETMNFDKAVNIGVLYDASDEENHNKVTVFVRHLQGLGKNVKALGVLNYKIIPHYCMEKLSFNFISQKDINWYQKPTGKYVDDFLNNSFDILVDLNLIYNESTNYIALLSDAKFKIGIFSDENQLIYDFMLQGEDVLNINTFIKQLMIYMEIIKN